MEISIAFSMVLLAPLFICMSHFSSLTQCTETTRAQGVLQALFQTPFMTHFKIPAAWAENEDTGEMELRG